MFSMSCVLRAYKSICYLNIVWNVSITSRNVGPCVMSAKHLSHNKPTGNLNYIASNGKAMHPWFRPLSVRL